MILSDREILACNHAQNENGAYNCIIDPFTSNQLQPASYDLTLLNQLRVGEDLNLITFHDHYSLMPDEFVLASTVEYIRMPTDLVGQIAGKSSRAREGLIIENAGWIDPGFCGQLTLEMKNISMRPIKLTNKMRIAQLVFMQLTSPAQRPYGHNDLGSHYQDQKGPVMSSQA